jgi:hypothetical protein
MQVVNVSGVNQEGAEAEKQQVSAVHSTDEDKDEADLVHSHLDVFLERV